MALYFFHFRGCGRQWMPDLQGERLPNLATAEQFAQETAEALAGCNECERWRGWRVEVTDEEGAVLSKVPVFNSMQYH